jgi:hypothetical protein
MAYLLTWLLLVPQDVLPNPPPNAPQVVVEAATTTVCPAGYTCVVDEDMKAFLQLLRDQKCRAETQPTITADPVIIVVDRKGRVFGSGTGVKPYHLKFVWCNYQLDAQTNIHLDVAQHVEPTWGFRLRLKAAAGVLALDAFKDKKMYEALDGGLLVEPFFIQWANLNGYVGFRSVGLGLGFDLTTNFGGYAGYALTWGSWRSNPFIGVYFAF